MPEPIVEPPPVNEAAEIIYITPGVMTYAFDYPLCMIALILYALSIAIMIVLLIMPCIGFIQYYRFGLMSAEADDDEGKKRRGGG